MRTSAVMDQVRTMVEAAGLTMVWDGHGATPVQFSSAAARDIRDEVADLLEETSQPEDTGDGYMEYFDWMALCKPAELVAAARAYGIRMADCSEPDVATYEALCAADREIFAKRVWAAM